MIDLLVNIHARRLTVLYRHCNDYDVIMFDMMAFNGHAMIEPVYTSLYWQST